MKESESKAAQKNLIKEKIRDRYKGINIDELDVIPARPHEDFYKSDVHKRVAVYARVSTDDPNQTSSYELQKNYYEDMVRNHANWELVDIYADEGISGTSLDHRDSFVRMIADCHDGKIDLIVTKSVSRFARNIIDCIGYSRQLKAMDPPIGIYFETEHIFTLDENSEMALSFIATLAQEESHTKSEIMNSSIEMRFKRGIFLTPVLLGYDHDDQGNLIINEDEAKTVRLIFFSYLYGYSTQKIADALTQLERYTKKGNQYWSSSSVLQILSNERYCGDVLARKTFTPNYLNHKSKKNNHDRNQYRQKNHHQAIISREDFFAVQKLLRNAKYGNKGYFPEMHVINDGMLKGFVSIHPRWAGFSEEDYYEASDSVEKEDAAPRSSHIELKIQKGTFDLSGYEIVRRQFISLYGQPMMSITDRNITFNTACVQKIMNTEKIELYIHPWKRILVAKRASEDTKNSMQWAKKHEESYVPVPISGAAFIPVLYKMFGWNPGNRYKITGTYQTKNSESVLIFNAADAYVLSNKVPIYPSEWGNSFGNDYYRSIALANDDIPQEESLDTTSTNTIKDSDSQNVTTLETAATNIRTILNEIGADDD